MLASGTGRLVLLTTSPRVAPGLLTFRAWEALRAAPAVLTAMPDHPLLAALAEAGVGYEVVAGSGTGAGAAVGAGVGPGGGSGGGAATVAGVLAGLAAEAAGAAGAPVWLAAPGGDEATGELLAALGELPGGGPEIELLAGSRDLPGARLLDLVSVMDTLRVQCPWDAKQTHETLAPHLLEESYEALEALEEGDQAALREELGDVLLQVAFHARVAAERSDGTGYTIDDVADGIVTKLVRRHPHVFGDVEVAGADEVKQNWDAIKAAERAAKDDQPVSVLAGVPFGQPALALVAQLQRRAERSGVPASLAEEDSLGGAAPPAPAGGDVGAASAVGAAGVVSGAGEALGAELFRLIARARAAGLDPELELRAAARRYRDRVRAWERTRPQS